MGPGVINYGNITLGTSRKHSFGAHLGSFGPLEASRGQTRQTMEGIKVGYDILERLEASHGPGSNESRYITRHLGPFVPLEASGL